MTLEELSKSFDECPLPITASGFKFIFDDGVEFEISQDQFKDIFDFSKPLASKIINSWEEFPCADTPIIVEDKRDG